MPIELRCPNGHRLRVADESAGKQARCPVCQAIVQVPVPADDEADSPAPAEEPTSQPEPTAPEDRAGRKRKRARKAARRARRLGLKIVGWGLLLNALGVIANIAAAALIIGSVTALIAAGLMRKEEDEPGALGGVITVVVFLGVGLAVLAPILGAVGKVLCCWVPRAAMGRGLVMTSIGCDVAQFVVPIVAVLVGVSTAFVEKGKVAWGSLYLQLFLNIFAICLWLTAILMFLAFLNRVALFVDEEGYAEDAQNLMKWAVFIGVTPIAMVLLLLIPFCGSCFSFILSLALLVVAVLFVISYLRLLFGLRSVVS